MHSSTPSGDTFRDAMNRSQSQSLSAVPQDGSQSSSAPSSSQASSSAPLARPAASAPTIPRLASSARKNVQDLLSEIINLSPAQAEAHFLQLWSQGVINADTFVATTANPISRHDADSIARTLDLVTKPGAKKPIVLGQIIQYLTNAVQGDRDDDEEDEKAPAAAETAPRRVNFASPSKVPPPSSLAQAVRAPGPEVKEREEKVNELATAAAVQRDTAALASLPNLAIARPPVKPRTVTPKKRRDTQPRSQASVADRELREVFDVPARATFTAPVPRFNDADREEKAPRPASRRVPDDSDDDWSSDHSSSSASSLSHTSSSEYNSDYEERAEDSGFRNRSYRSRHRHDRDRDRRRDYDQSSSAPAGGGRITHRAIRAFQRGKIDLTAWEHRQKQKPHYGNLRDLWDYSHGHIARYMESLLPTENKAIQDQLRFLAKALEHHIQDGPGGNLFDPVSLMLYERMRLLVIAATHGWDVANHIADSSRPGHRLYNAKDIRKAVSYVEKYVKGRKSGNKSSDSSSKRSNNSSWQKKRRDGDDDSSKPQASGAKKE